MEWVETTGRTVEEAKEAALDQLGVDEQDAEFEVIEEPRFGLFGRLRSEARVRARVRPTKPRAKEERRDRRGRKRSPGSDGVAAAADDDTAATPALRSASRRPPEATTAEASATPAVAAAGDDDESGGESAAGRPRRTRATGTAPAGGSRSAAARSPRPADRDRRSDNNAHQNDDSTSPGGGMDVALDEQGAVAKEFLDGLVERMSLEAEIAIAQPEEETIELNLEGPDLGLLIGPKGSTLLALQDLTRTVVQRKTSAANGRILVDVSGYRRKRKDALARFTRQVAQEVVSSGTRRALEPMTAADRKIVHDTVNEIDGVMTMSEGEDPRRRVVILPIATDAADS
jgi:spoIIIJ-associated protein